jgi:hypothetical protein
MKNLLFLFLLIIINSSVLGQKIVVKGNVKNGAFGNSIGSIIEVFHNGVELSKTQTDINGNYLIEINVGKGEKIGVLSTIFSEETNKIVEVISDTIIVDFNATTLINSNLKTASSLKKISSPGNELQLFSKHMYIGYSLTMLGSAVFATSAYTSVSSNKIPVGGYVVGGVITLVGSIFLIEAPIHIKKAGLLLNENGVGINIKL